jgi:hypothetical protein
VDVVDARPAEVLLDGEPAAAGDQQRVAHSQLAPAQALCERGQPACVEPGFLCCRDLPVAFARFRGVQRLGWCGIGGLGRAASHGQQAGQQRARPERPVHRSGF